MTPPVLFQASNSALKLNVALRCGPRNLTPEQARVDAEFDSCMPEGGIGRSKALFAGDDAAFCTYYLTKQRPAESKNGLFIYRVDMPDSTKHPMILVGWAKKFFDDKDALDAIIAEYWCPTQDWSCWEYLGSSMTPTAVEVMPDAGQIAGASFRYTKDVNLAKQLWRPTI